MKNNRTPQKIVELRQELDVAKEIMVNTVEKLIQRAQLIENLDQKTKDIRNQTQAFPLASNELKIKLRTRHAAISGAIICGILGVSYGLINGHTKEGAAIGAVIAGVPASMLGGLIGHKLGAVSGLVERLWFRAVYAYGHFRPMQTLREKAYSWYYKDKMSVSTEHAQEMLSQYKNDENKNDENKMDENKIEHKKVNEPELDHSVLSNNTKIIAHGFESKKCTEKQDISKAEIKIAAAQPRARM